MSCLSWTDLDAVAFHARQAPRRQACADLRTGEVLDYAGLDDLVGRVGAWLEAALGVGPGARVAVVARNGLEALVLSFACERIGAAFVPLNWRLTGAELGGLVRDAEPVALLFQAEFKDSALEAAAAAPSAQVLEISSQMLRESAAGFSPVRPHPAAPDEPSIILYTSGTSGKPKGVILTRAGVFWGALNFAAVGQVDTASVMLCDAPMFHTVGLIATCRCVMQAGGAVLLSDRFVPEQALARLSDPELAITHLFGVPQMAQTLVDSPAFATADLSRLKGLFLGGAPLPEALCRTLLDRGVLVVNGYGMTEACTVVGMPLDAELVRRRMASAGLAAPAVDIRICSAEGELLPPGKIGEICLRGPAITPGYWNQPAATAAAFRDGWLRTGDAGYLDQDGYLFLVDRWKDMYISGGENVYPAEVESAISLLAGVREVAVVGKPDGRWGEVGCAFVVLHPGAALSAQDVLDHCQGRLARYKHPADIRFVETLPRTASGKLRKDQLRGVLA